MATLSNNILGIEFENPFVLASAPPTASIESIDKAFELGWGGAVLKTITPDNLELNEVSPRYAVLKNKAETIGFQNVELLSHETVDYWCKGIKYLKEKHPTKVVIASIMAPVEKDSWQNLVNTLNKTSVDAYELNFSCPHGMPEQNIGMAIGTSAEISSMITSWVKEVATKPVFVKLTPNVTDITNISKAVEKAGADGLALINTVLGFMGVELDKLEPKLCVNGFTTYGGCSGKIVKPIGLRCVSQVRNTSSLPIMGMGGISTWKDAAEYILLGSDVVQICSEVMLNGYSIINSLKSGLLAYMESKGFDNISQMKGLISNKITTHEKLDKKFQLYPFVDSENCIKCGKCVNICSESEHKALSKEDSIIVDKDKCVGCSLCSLVCPMSAITMK